MNEKDKRRFVVELIANVQTEILSRVKEMPDEWDGHELQYIESDSMRGNRSLSWRSSPRGIVRCGSAVSI